MKLDERGCNVSTVDGACVCVCMFMGVVPCIGWTQGRVAESMSTNGFMLAPSPLQSIKRIQSKQYIEYTRVILQTPLLWWKMLLRRSGLVVLRQNRPVCPLTKNTCMMSLLLLLIVARITFILRFVLHSSVVTSNETAGLG